MRKILQLLLIAGKKISLSCHRDTYVMLSKFQEFLVRFLAKDSFSSDENIKYKYKLITFCTKKIEKCETLGDKILSCDDHFFPIPLGTVITKNTWLF